jgi:hypothetical protein
VGGKSSCLTDGSQRLPGVAVSGVIFPEKMPAAEGLGDRVVSRGRLGRFSLSLSLSLSLYMDMEKETVLPSTYLYA